MRRADAVARTDAILLAAKEVFLERGYDAASMDEVALRAETTKRTVYNHFSNKDELFRAVVEFSVRLFASRMPEFDPSAPVESQLEYFAARYLELATWADSIRLQRAIFAERERFPDLAAYVYQATTAQALERVRDYLQGKGSREPVADAALFLNAATSHARIERLHGVGEVLTAPPGDEVSPAVDRKLSCRAARLIASTLPR